MHASISHAVRLLLALTPVVVSGQSTDLSSAPRAPHRLVVDQLTGELESRSADGSLAGRWSLTAPRGGRTAVVAVPLGVPIEVEIRHANPLLYKYEVQATVVATQPLPACRTVGSRLVSSGVLGAFATAATGTTQPLVAPSMGQLFQPPPAEPLARGDALLTDAALSGLLAAHQAAVEDYVRFLRGVRALPQLLTDSIAMVAELAESAPIDSLLDALAASIERAYPGLSQPARISALIRTRVQSAQPHVTALRSAAGAIARGAYEGNEALGPAAAVARLVAEVAMAEQDQRAAARLLQAQALRLQLARSKSRQVFTLEGSNAIRRIAIDVQPSGEFPEAFRARVGRQELVAQPTVSALCQVSLGVAFMERPATYGLQGDVVTRESAEQRSAVAVLLHLATARFPYLAALTGMGFGRDGVPDLYAGASLRFLDPLLVNMGVAWQRAQVLPTGFSVGQAAPDPSAMARLDTRYRPNFFWGVSLAR